MTELSKHYTPSEVEDKWYEHWESKGYFRSTPDEREPYTILIPPPNVTGVLHMGHMLNNTIQDILARRARQENKNVCWVPGTDHASIATEAKVVRHLREKGIKKSDLTRDEFLEHAWEWKEKYGGIILGQLRKLGASADWERTAFTMDEKRSKSVLKVFVDLYRKGKLYRKDRMVNWDPMAQTVLSNEEVIYAEENARLYHVRYKIEGREEYITIATTRPETILGDTAIAVHPEDSRYTHLHGARVHVPLTDRTAPIILDDYVDREFGTGALKVTPAHDVNDYEIGLRHELEVIDVLHPDGRLNEFGLEFEGMDREKARKAVAKKLEELGDLVKAEEYTHNVGRSERTRVPIEPRLSLQWYVDMKQLVDPALEAVLESEVKIHPKKYLGVYRHWMDNIQDWCISRQLWWGHRIPAWFYMGEDGEEKVFVAETAEEALAEARQTLGISDLQLSDLRQDEDVLDTWFSSWLWPISVFDGFESQEEVDYYYPTAVLVTGWDIIFLWVARMIMAGYEWRADKPFRDVYFTGMVRDQQRRKMSKQLGNSPDALKLIADFGADSVRFGMMSCSPAGGDLLFDEKLIETGKNFCNKLWNALKLIRSWEVDQTMEQALENKFAYDCLREGIAQQAKRLEGELAKFRLSEALKELYSFIWNQYCSWYLEIVKSHPRTDAKTQEQAVQLYRWICQLLHPFMPFVTEEIWSLLPGERATDLMVSLPEYPSSENADLLLPFEAAKELISKVRDLRNKNGISPKERVTVYYLSSNTDKKYWQDSAVQRMVLKLANLEDLVIATESDTEEWLPFAAGTEKYWTDLQPNIDADQERSRLEKEIKRLQGFITGIEKKLSNARFVDNAPEAVVAKEKQKLQDSQSKLENAQSLLSRL